MRRPTKSYRQTGREATAAEDWFRSAQAMCYNRLFRLCVPSELELILNRRGSGLYQGATSEAAEKVEKADPSPTKVGSG